MTSSVLPKQRFADYQKFSEIRAKNIRLKNKRQITKFNKTKPEIPKVLKKDFRVNQYSTLYNRKPLYTHTVSQH